MKLRAGTVVVILAAIFSATRKSAAEAPASASAAFDTYVRTVEARLWAQHARAAGFIVAPAAADANSSPQAEPLIERVAAPEVAGGLIHHWRATEFLPGVKAADLDRLLKDFAAYPRVFAPQVGRAHGVMVAPDHFHVAMRVRQRHVISVVLDQDYDVSFGVLDPAHRYSISRSTQVREIDSPGTTGERALPAEQEHGFLWRQNTYWSWEERDGGVWVQMESISLTRATPSGLGWAVGPYIATIPRDSLEFTLACARKAFVPPDRSAIHGR